MEIIITNHAYERMKERAGFNKSAALRMSKTAFKNGIHHGDTTGSLNRYISSKCLAYADQKQVIRIYGEFVYCFCTNGEKDKLFLVTVYGIPKKFRNNSNSKQRKKKNNPA